MTKEEAIFCEKSYLGETNCVDCKYYGTDTCESRESHKMAITALELEPCEDAISKQAVIRTIYDRKSDFKNDFAQGFFADKIRDLPLATPKPTECEDAVGREAVREGMIKYGFHAPDMIVTEFVEDELPSVTPKPRTGKWIIDGHHRRCSICENSFCVKDREGDMIADNFCPNCGAKMEGVIE